MIQLTQERQVGILRKMLLIRRFEEKAVELFLQGKGHGFIHSYAGEEAVAVGLCENLRRDDYITSTHRGHGHCLAKGLDPTKMVAEILGKRSGTCRGKGGSMHIIDLDGGVLGTNGIVGGGIPLATGAALFAKTRGLDRVCVSFFGEGAAAQGILHECLNISALWKLPLIFVCEDNQYAQFNPRESHLSINRISDFASAYGIPGTTVDGMDVEVVLETAENAVDRARSGKGPSLIECRTYRFFGHYTGDLKQGYRDRDEVRRWKSEKDPIDIFKRRLLERGVTDEIITKMESEIRNQLNESFTQAESDPYPEPEETLQDVYAAQMPWHPAYE